MYFYIILINFYYICNMNLCIQAILKDKFNSKKQYDKSNMHITVEVL